MRPRREVERWFLELRDPVFRYLRSMGCPPSLSEDITQESFLRLHRAGHDGFGVKEVRAWVFRVARNLCIDHRREHQRLSITSEEGWAYGWKPVHIDSAPNPEQRVLRRERMRLIQEEFLRLPELQRECLLLKAQGLRYYEIAKALDISMTAAVDGVRRGVKKLRRRI